MAENRPIYKRVLINFSGEALLGGQPYGIDPDFLTRIRSEVVELSRMGVEVALVVGGGNIFRGAGLAEGGMERVTGDHMGMLATVINALAIQDAIERQGAYCRVMSALEIKEVCENYIRRRAVRHLQKGRIVVFAAGTGNPFFTTDTAASLRAMEIGADVMMKATRVDGVYDKDPLMHSDARRYESITYDEVLRDKLAVMDATAIVMCRDYDLSLQVFNLNEPGELVRAVCGQSTGTLVTRKQT
jgi:uridylate kinase